MERHLATIQRILDLKPIKDADKIEQATILGWSLVVQKGVFKIGDLAVFCEIDSILPDKPEFEFLRSKKFRIRTIRLKGVISQGIAFPTTILPEEYRPLSLSDREVEEGSDVTELLGVTKYEVSIPICMTGIMKGGFPSFIPKTDEERIQNIPWVLDIYQCRGPFICTEKLDGTSVTYYIKDNVFGVCSRNVELARPDLESGQSKENIYWKIAEQYNIENNMRNFGDNFAIQGEIIGPGIQGNKYGLNEHKLFIFNFFDIDLRQYADVQTLDDIVEKLDLLTVPYVDQIDALPLDVETLVKSVARFSTIAPFVHIEGYVIRPKYNIIDQQIGRLSFKVINLEFLLKYGE